ncbi:MAG: hypothetical protein ACUVR2_12225 [Anaerolineae bacterium]
MSELRSPSALGMVGLFYEQCSISLMRIHPAVAGRERGLIKFDISIIPTTATVLQATLYLYAWY